MEWVIAAITFTILYGLARVLHVLWDAGYWFLVFPLPFAILWTAYICSSEQHRQMFRDDVRALMRRR